jgi:hypothetical protein
VHPLRGWSRLIFESGLIVFSVLLALLLNEVRTHFSTRAEHAAMLRNVQQEIAHNSSLIKERYLPVHSAIVAKLDELAARPEQLSTIRMKGLSQVDLLPEGTWVPDMLQDAAWEVASNSTTLTYEERFAFARVYRAQTVGVERSVARVLDLLMSAEFGDPARAESSLRQLRMIMRELVSQESFLVDSLYRDVLARRDLWSNSAETL